MQATVESAQGPAAFQDEVQGTGGRYGLGVPRRWKTGYLCVGILSMCCHLPPSGLSSLIAMFVGHGGHQDRREKKPSWSMCRKTIATTSRVAQFWNRAWRLR